MSEKTKCAGGEAPKLIFPCSGGSDVGLKKGDSPATDENIAKVAQKAVLLLAC